MGITGSSWDFIQQWEFGAVSENYGQYLGIMGSSWELWAVAGTYGQ